MKRLLRKVLPLRASVFERYRKQLADKMSSLSSEQESRARIEDERYGSLEKTLEKVAEKLSSSVSRVSDLELQVDNGLRQLDEISKMLTDNGQILAMVNRESLTAVEVVRSLQTALDPVTSRLSESADKAISGREKANEVAPEPAAKVLYEQNWEKEAIEPFRQILFASNLREKFYAMARGMDRGSIKTLATIIDRQRMVLESEDSLDIFTPREQEALLEVRRCMKNDVIKLADDAYCFNGYLLPLNHFEPSVFLYRHGLDALSDLSSVSKGDVIDVGGFIGDSAIVLSPLTQGKVISFEASQENFNLMLKTLDMNDARNVIPEHLALGAQNGFLEISFKGSATQAASLSKDGGTHTERVPMTTLDDYCEGRGLNIGLIKVDIEGYEQEFLKGARKTIESHRPVLLLSIYHNPDDFYNIKPMIESWNLGYTFSIHKPIDNTVSREVLLIAEPMTE